MASGHTRIVAGVLGLLTPALVSALWVQAAPGGDDRERDLVQYMTTAPDDAIARLQKQIDAGSVRLAYDRRHGYLPGVLKQLGIPTSSQGLVFSRTSFQLDRISPRAPRAVYFNDDVYVGWVQGSELMEFSAVDPTLGAVFYVLRNVPGGRPKFVRQTYDCLQCHESSMTAGIPGHIVRSVFAGADGRPDFASGTYLTTDESPISERFGGWYVTGKHGAMRHMGNAFLRGGDGYATLDRDSGANLTDLSRFFDTTPYLQPGSDIVAQMVLQHQSRVHNLLTKANWQTRLALEDEKILNESLGRPEGYHSESTASRIRSVCEPLLQAMLFAREQPLSAPIAGNTTFTRDFASAGPRDIHGRSLRNFDLRTRLFRYPCSFLIYSEAFDALPRAAKEYLWPRLWEVLESREKGDDYARLSKTDREAIKEILLATKPDFKAARPKADVE